MDCPSPLRCYACGGRPPYKWTVTNGTLDVDEGIKVKVSPPVNVNPGEAGTAYSWGARYCSFGGFNDCACQFFTCAGVGGACTGIGCNGTVSCGNCAGGFAAGCTLFTTGGIQGPECDALPVFPDPCVGLQALHFTVDLRTQTMKDNGCRPCEAEMNNVVITVTDSFGESVSKVIKT